MFTASVDGTDPTICCLRSCLFQQLPTGRGLPLDRIPEMSYSMEQPMAPTFPAPTHQFHGRSGNDCFALQDQGPPLRKLGAELIDELQFDRCPGPLLIRHRLVS